MDRDRPRWTMSADRNPEVEHLGDGGVRVYFDEDDEDDEEE